MPAARRARNTIPLYQSDDESDNETPKPQRTALKKRLSDVYNPDGDKSPSRVPLKSVNINDDAAEKRRRRKSTKHLLIENAQAGPSSEGNMGEPSSEAPQGDSSRAARQRQQLKSLVVDAPAIEVPVDILASNYEEWMKMATDNKINSGNSWNVALIDYFHDMSLLRNTDDDTINFQRASCTLDGCVKIWTSRVDSVGTEAGKLMNGLAAGNDGDDDDDAVNNSDDPDARGGDSKAKKRSHRPESTLKASAEELKGKKPELEFSVDPLFKKTCADFDEGGAQGLLMNHLSLGLGAQSGMRVVFDASDSMGTIAEEEDPQEPEVPVDLSYLREQFMPHLSILEDRTIAPSIAEFSFSQENMGYEDTSLFRDDTPHLDNDDDEDEDNFPSVPMNLPDESMDIDGVAPPPPPVEDFFQGDEAVHDDFDYNGGGGDDDGGGDYGGSGEGGSVGAEADQGHAGGGGGAGSGGPLMPFDLRAVPNERDLVMAMTEGGGDDMIDYFDQNVLKNWAGPEHWKVRRVRRPDVAETKKAAPKQKKEVFKIDFLTPSEKDLKEIANELFAPPTRGASINLPGTGTTSAKSRSKKKDKEKKDDHRLPDDMHFSSRELVKLFHKPNFSLKMRGQNVRFNENGDGEVDQNFWAQAAANEGNSNDEDDAAAPFNTQFFNDDDDDFPGGGFDEGFEGGSVMPGSGADLEPGEQDLLAATQGLKRKVRPEFVNYSRRAKRVDVRKLKENIWKGLNIVTTHGEDDRMNTDEEPPEVTDPSEARVFSSVISGLQKSYAKEKMEEISTSFCFICLLHLANEQGLKIKTTDDQAPPPEEALDEEQALEKKVGNLWDLKVYRDPDATPSA